MVDVPQIVNKLVNTISKLKMTLYSKTLINPQITKPTVSKGRFDRPEVIHNIAKHNYVGGAVDWVLDTEERAASILILENANGAVNVIAPSSNRIYVVKNSCGFTCTFKSNGTVGVTIAHGNVAMVVFTGSNYERVS